MTEENILLPTEKNIEDYELLKNMLYSQKYEFDLLSKKKTDGQLNPMKIKMVNRVLEPLKEFCKQDQSYKFLDTLNEDELPTYSDVVLIISQYETALKYFKNKYYSRDKYKRDVYGNLIIRWMTQEYPPDYYSNEDNIEDYDENEK